MELLCIQKSLFLHLSSLKKHFLIESAPSTNLSALEKWLGKLSEIVIEFGIDSPESIAALKAIAELAGLKFDLNVLSEAELNDTLSAIAEVNFPQEETKEDKSRKPGRAITLEEHQALLIIQLVNAELAVDLESALKVAREVPHKTLEKYIEARIRFLNGDKIDAEEAAKGLMQELKDGSFFGKPKDGKDPFRDGVFAAMGMRSPKQTEQPKNQDMPDSVKKALGLD